MKSTAMIALAGALLVMSSVAHADGPVTREYSRRGEVSPDSKAPDATAMVKAIEHGSAQRLRATLEYGERVRCEDCVPLLYAKVLASDDASVRELSAWWLRRQPFAAPIVLGKLRKIVKSDADAEQRARAAEALGEMMDPHALPELTDAALEDKAVRVRAAATRALARLNSEAAGATFADVLADKSAEVRLAALEVLIRVRSFTDVDALVPLLDDTDVNVRMRAARLCGELRVRKAEKPLVQRLKGDPARQVRSAAAWALGRIGGAAGHDAIRAAARQETDDSVLDTLEIAQRMPVRF